MRTAEQLDHLCAMIDSNAHHCWLSNMEGDYGYVMRLSQVADSGAFATPDMSEIRHLHDAHVTLRRLADEIEKVENTLLQNSIKRVA